MILALSQLGVSVLRQYNSSPFSNLIARPGLAFGGCSCGNDRLGLGHFTNYHSS